MAECKMPSMGSKSGFEMLNATYVQLYYSGSGAGASYGCVVTKTDTTTYDYLVVITKEDYYHVSKVIEGTASVITSNRSVLGTVVVYNNQVGLTFGGNWSSGLSIVVFELKRK